MNPTEQATTMPRHDESKITYAEYWREVKALAKQIKKEARGNEERESDLLHETIDGHEWIIYTWAYPWVLMHSANEGAAFDDHGSFEAKDYSQTMQLMAFYALRQDVAEELSSL